MKKIWLCSLLLLCSHFAMTQTLRDELSKEQKIYGLSTLWSEVNNNFVFLDRLEFDFDSLYMSTIPKVIDAKDNFEYIHVLRKFLEALDDQHTGIMYEQFYWNDGDYPPVFLKKEDNKFFVTRIAKDVAEEIPVGSELLKADGIPYAEYKKISPAGNLFSYVKTTVLLEFKTPKERIIEKAFIRNFNHQYRTKNPIEMASSQEQNNSDWKPYEYTDHNGFSLVKVNTFQSDTVVKRLQKDIDQINLSKGLILDVRKNGGGNSDHSKALAQHLVEKNMLVGPSWKTRINNGAKKAWGSMAIFDFEDDWTKENKQYWNNDAWEINPPDTSYISSDINKVTVPIIILMGENTFSAAEDFLIYTLGNANITKIGQYSAGSSGQPLAVTLPGGILARICSKRDALPDGTDYIGVGIKPDVFQPKEADLLEIAIAEINN